MRPAPRVVSGILVSLALLTVVVGPAGFRQETTGGLEDPSEDVPLTDDPRFRRPPRPDPAKPPSDPESGSNSDTEMPLESCDVPLNETRWFREVRSFARLHPEQEERLATQCLLAVDWLGSNGQGFHDVQAAYETMRTSWMPVLITSDSVLHAYHALFDSILLETESRFLVRDMRNVSESMMTGSMAQRDFLPSELDVAAAYNAAFFALALKLFDRNASIPSELQTLVDAERSLITSHLGLVNSHLMGYPEDYTQYVPRGHYDVNDTLRGYFLGMMWYGRMGFRLGSDSHVQRAVLLTDLWARLPDSVRSLWWRVYNVTAFFVGESDDLLPVDFLPAVRSVFGSLADPSALLDPAKLEAFRALAVDLRNPRVLSDFILDDQDPVGLTKGLRFMGQRYVLDSHVFQLVVYDKVGQYFGSGAPFTLSCSLLCIRGVPRGLDVMAAMGSNLAATIVAEEGDAEYHGFPGKAEEARNLFRNVPSEGWNDTLYLSWLRALREGVAVPDDPRLPSFMQTEAYAAKSLHTSLGSWAQLRHDTILYVKQSYTVTLTSTRPSFSDVYVEPVLPLWRTLRQLLANTQDGLTVLGILGPNARLTLSRMLSLLDTLIRVSQNQLEGTAIEPRDQSALYGIDDVFQQILTLDADARDTRIVADVHTDVNSGEVLEEGTGNLGLFVVILKRSDGSWAAFVGPIFTYHEFRHPMTDRLTDGKWRDLLATSPPPRAPWLSRFWG